MKQINKLIATFDTETMSCQSAGFVVKILSSRTNFVLNSMLQQFPAAIKQPKRIRKIGTDGIPGQLLKYVIPIMKRKIGNRSVDTTIKIHSAVCNRASIGVSSSSSSLNLILRLLLSSYGAPDDNSSFTNDGLK